MAAVLATAGHARATSGGMSPRRRRGKAVPEGRRTPTLNNLGRAARSWTNRVLYAGPGTDRPCGTLRRNRGSRLRFHAAITSVLLFTVGAAHAGEDCFHGPVPVNPAYRAQINIPKGHAARLTFTYNALWQNMIFVCDALTGERLAVRGNSRNAEHEDWLSPIDNTRSLTYYVVAFHKTASEDSSDIGSRAWYNSSMKLAPREIVQGTSGAYVDGVGFNDGGGDGWDNAVVTAYIVGAIPELGHTPDVALHAIRTNLHNAHISRTPKAGG